MSKLKNIIKDDFSTIQKRADLMFKVFTSDMGKMIDEANKDVIATIAAVLSMHKESEYKRLVHNHTLDSLDQVIKGRYQVLVHKLEMYWSQKRDQFDLLSRLAAGFIGRKSSPPWLETKLNLKDELSTDGKYDPRRGHFDYCFRNITDALIKEIQKGLLNEESMSQIMQRVRKLFNRNSKQNVREAEKWDYFKPSLDDAEPVYKLQGPVNISEGTFTLEDIEDLQLEQQRAMQWEYRQYRPWFSDELKANNRYLRGLEELLMSDALDQLHNGLLQIGPKEFGIDDMEWAVSRPQPKCDECTTRDGLTMKEIKAKIKDDFGDQVPPLHPNCLLPDTIVSAAGISKHFKRWFDGEVITIRIKGKDDITITPNHPVLTNRGWVDAGKLQKTDKLICSTDDRSIVDILDPNNNQVQTTIENLPSSFQMSRNMFSMRVPVSSENFHGDGIIDTEVDIIFFDSFLSHNFMSEAFKMVKEKLFVFMHSCWISFYALCSFLQIRVISFATPNGGLSRHSIFCSNFWGSLFHSNKHRFASISNLKSMSFKRRPNRPTMDSDSPSNIYARLSSHVELVKIEDLIFSKFTGHVYNLETKDGYYLANSLIVHNCRCQLIPRIKDEWADKALKNNDDEWDPSTGIVYRASKQEKDLGLNDMTFDEYLKAVGR